jgi:hypothetical protein
MDKHYSGHSSDTTGACRWYYRFWTAFVSHAHSYTEVSFSCQIILPSFCHSYRSRIFPFYLKLRFQSHQLISSAAILNFKIELLTKKERDPVTSLERSWPSQQKLVSKLLTTNKRTMRSEQDSGVWRPGTVSPGQVAEEGGWHENEEGDKKTKHGAWLALRHTELGVEQKSDMDWIITVLDRSQNNSSL